jgi:hypothetical protein
LHLQVVQYLKKLTMIHDGSYTWKIYAPKVLNMGSTYGFWRTLNMEEKIAKQCYLQMFHR